MIRRIMVASGLLAVLLFSATAFASNGHQINKGSREKYTVALIGDVPYGTTKINAFPQFVQFINADPKVDLVAHVGDIKNGSTLCSDTYFQQIRSNLDGFKDPVVYTPGDNEWVDCHRANNGSYTPTERLDALRRIFFPAPGKTLGERRKRVMTEANEDDERYDDGDHASPYAPYVENVMWMESKTVFATLNIQGSSDDNPAQAPWTVAGDPSYPSQSAEYAARRAANLHWIEEAFDRAKANRAKGVVLLFQADMWDTTETFARLASFDPIINAIGTEAQNFDGQVLLVEGDSHVYENENPFDVSSPLHSLHANTPVASNIQRIVVEGSTTQPCAFEYLRLTVNPRLRGAAMFSWDRVDDPIANCP